MSDTSSSTQDQTGPDSSSSTIPAPVSNPSTTISNSSDLEPEVKQKKKRPKTNRLQLSFDDFSETPTTGDLLTNDLGQIDENQSVSLALNQVDVPVNTDLQPSDDSERASLKFIDVAANEKRVQKLISQIEEEWDRKQEEIKKEPLTVVFSWWDGSGHRIEDQFVNMIYSEHMARHPSSFLSFLVSLVGLRLLDPIASITISKGDTVLQFLAAAQKAIVAKGFTRVNAIPPHQLMYVKEDLILPLHYTFYEFIASNSRGKSGSLVDFGVKDDVRLQGNTKVERDDSHAGKVMEKSYFDSNKHIFPYNRFETFDPKKTYDKYTIA